MADPSKSQKLEGKVAIVTGGASGIGEATAYRFVDNGARAVVIADIQDDKGHIVASAIGSHRCTYIHCDVTDEHQVKFMIDETIKIYGQLDIMFSNAGYSNPTNQTIMDLDLAAFDHMIAINLRGMVACVKHAAAAMVAGGTRGSIVCTASIAAHVVAPISVDYTISKTAVVGLMRSASLQLGAHGIRVNCVSPGAVATPMTWGPVNGDVEALEMMFEQWKYLKGPPLKARNIADAVLFLVSDDSALITGQNLVVDGGFQNTNSGGR